MNGQTEIEHIHTPKFVRQDSHNNSSFDTDADLEKLNIEELREISASLAQAQYEYKTFLETYQSERHELQKQLHHSNQIIGQIYASKSWRLTSPLRWIFTKIKLLLRKMKNGVKVFHEQGAKLFLIKLTKQLLPRQEFTPTLEYFGNLKDLNPNRETVLVVSHDASRTGAPILALNIVQHLSKKYNVVVMLLGHGTLIDDFRNSATIVIYPLPHKNRDNEAVSIIVDKFLNLCKIKFAIVNSIESRAVLQQLAQRFVPAIALIHEFASYTRPMSALRESIYWSYKSIFSANIVWENAVAANSEIGNRPAVIIPQGRCNLIVKADACSVANERTRILHAFRPQSWPQDTLVIIGIGSVHIRKGVDLFIDCAVRILRTTKKACRFIWIGHGFNPEFDVAYSVYLADQINRSGMEKYVTFLDETTQLEIAYQQANILLLSSRLDPLPNVAIDALAHGLPLVCFDKATGIADILHDHGLSNDCVASYLDTHDLAAKVQSLIESTEQRERISNRFKDIASKLFNMNNYVNRLEEIALKGVRDITQEHEDALKIASSGLLRLDFFPNPAWHKLDNETYARFFVRSMASGIGMRKPFPGFHPGIYWEQQKDLVQSNDPFAHFITAGKPTGPWVCELITPSNTIKQLISIKRIALHLHVYYPDLLEQIILNLNANIVKPHLLISVPSKIVLHKVKNITQQYEGIVADIQIVPNLGRDIGPLLTTFGKRIVENYDVIGHFHTKKSLTSHDKSMGKTWFTFLLENLIGGHNHVADRILARMDEDCTLGLVFPDDPSIIGWTANFNYAKPLAERMNLDLLPEYFNFPMGTMFWARSEALKPLIDLNLDWTDYPEEPVPIDGTVLHAIERLLPFVAKKAGFRYALTNVPGISR